MTKDRFWFRASDGTDIAAYRWIPETAPKGVIQISHGMAEYAMRYDRFACEAVKAGYAVYASDHRGHGETAGSLDKLGYLADRAGFERVRDDLHELTGQIKQDYPGTKPILFAHSFGSFIAQSYIENYGDDVSLCVLSGTRGPDILEVLPGTVVASVVAAIRGKKRRSNFLTDLSFGACNARIDRPESPNAWLSRDAAEVAAYDASPWCGFVCTAGFFRDLTSGLLRIHRSSAIASIPKDLPILIMSGTDDPISKYGKTVRRLARRYENCGIRDVTLRLYEGGRHESLNETNRDEVTAEILAWIEAR